MNRPPDGPRSEAVRPNGSKLAATVADRIVDDIAALGWPEGDVVGSEPELLARYGVSRAVFREAVRLVEHKQVARMRRGPGGGLVVTPPSVHSVADAVSVYLAYVGAEIDEVFEARLALEETAAQLAPERLDEPGIAALRALVAGEHDHTVDDPREMHRLVAALTGNPALELFVDLLNQVSLLYLPRSARLGPSTLAASAAAHAAIAEAVIAGDESLARGRMRKHLQAEAAYLRAQQPSRRRLADLTEAVGHSDKRGEATARQIFGEVTAAGWPVGALLGSEADLMARYGVSRAVLREAVRVLEHHQVARMRRGPGGGLFVAEPGIEAVTDAVALHVERGGIVPQHLFEVRRAVELTVLERVLATLDDQGRAALVAALAAERAASVEEFPAVGHDVHNVLARVSGNRVLELLTVVLIRVTRRHSAAPPGAPDLLPTQEVIHVHERVVDAIVAGDGELARHRMRRHLDALVDWVQ
ncbi:MAG TPA: FCD domain-containing protein [Acidimicrobiales bacterium]|nr:FCD domain-containing protein [Acidimicrobiales bacterium]